MSEYDTSLPQFQEAFRRIAECQSYMSAELDLADLNLTHVPEAVRELTWLKRLSLHDNALTTLPEWMGELKGLVSLKAHGNRLENVPLSLGHLRQLIILYLSGPIPLEELAHLQYCVKLQDLALFNMGLTQVPEWVRYLSWLERLLLDDNSLASLPDWLGDLQRLTYLYLRRNPLRSLPRGLLKHDALVRLELDDTSLGLPHEILSSHHSKIILDYYFKNLAPGEAQARPLNEFKLILVGYGGVGKTSLVQRLTTGQYAELPETHGIDIKPWYIEVGGEEVRAHVWDFGGQQIMHNTHRFFMTSRAVYLVLVTRREGNQQEDAEYWLSLIRSFAGDAPVLVLLHKWGEGEFEVNKGLLREKYGQDIGFLETDAKSGHHMEELRSKIEAMAAGLPDLKAMWPAAWQAVKQDLPEQQKHWLSFADFRSFCKDRKVEDPDEQEKLAGYLNLLGLMLYYGEDETLRRFGVLHPLWVTQGIYAMVTSKRLKAAGGKFSLGSFTEELDAEAYPKELHEYLLKLMQKFRLCHPLPDEAEHFLIPDLLTEEEPGAVADFNAAQSLGFVYRCHDVLPEGLMARFLVETFTMQEPDRAWRMGAVLKHDNCRALVRGDRTSREITVRVTGTQSGRRTLLGIIRHYFDGIHRGFKQLKVGEWVPIPGHATGGVEYPTLLKAERSNRATLTVDVGADLIDVTVKDLLDGVDVQGAPRAAPTGTEPETRSGPGEKGGLKVFVSYSHKDPEHKERLVTQLVPCKRQHGLEVWTDDELLPGKEWHPELEARVRGCDVFVLLMTPDALASDFCIVKELEWAREKRDGLPREILPVVVRPCDYNKGATANLHVLLPFG